MTTLTLPWTPELALLADDLDDDHRALLQRLNALLIAISSGDAIGVSMAFGALTVEAEAHFAMEETEMRDFDYPDRENHCERHRLLLQGLSELRYTVSAAETFPGSMGPFVFLERWLVPHLQHDDRKLADFLALRKTATTAAGDASAASA